MKRRSFLKRSIMATGGLLIGGKLSAAAHNDAFAVVERLVILHTNDVHSRIDPFPMDGSRNQGLGGVAERAAVINEIRSKEQHVLLLDAGDIFQGTPYFNIYKGEPEIKAMSAMNYDASTIGNHDFDAGIQNFALQLQHATFSIVNCNYNFIGTSMENKAKPYIVLKRGKIKIGVTGVGIELNGLVPDSLTDGITYNDPVSSLERTTKIMKEQEHCDLIICLSHLGYKYSDDKISDVLLAQQSENVDIIIGGHTHTFMKQPEVVKNKVGADVIINQVGFAGIQLGRLDIEMLKNKNKKLTKAHNIVIEKKS